jgi:glycosyltransferase involved in cell wall biosynthesis
MKKLTSLTIFFPFYNDAGTVEQAITDAYKYGRKVAEKLEVIAIHGGRSRDNTMAKIIQQKLKHKDLKIIDKTKNYESYAVIKHGFSEATKDWVFYTDGDLQYEMRGLEKLVKKQLQTGADLVNGYKKQRGDSPARVFLGNLYKKISKFIYKLPIRDLTCDFRLIRKKLVNNIKFSAHDSSILLELIKKLERKGAKFSEVPVRHSKRQYGKSSYNLFKLLKERLFGDLITYLKLVSDKPQRGQSQRED